MENAKVVDLSRSELISINGGADESGGWGLLGKIIAVYDAVTDFAKGFASGWAEATKPPNFFK
jgi:hypothetical protein